MTTPSKPSSEISRLLPPPRTKTGSERPAAQASASRTSSTEVARKKKRAGPPMPMVVNGARGTFSCRSISDVRRTIQELCDYPDVLMHVAHQLLDRFDQ